MIPGTPRHGQTTRAATRRAPTRRDRVPLVAPCRGRDLVVLMRALERIVCICDLCVYETWDE
jgi:hypothetical protein